MKDAASALPVIGYDRRRVGWRYGTGIHHFRDGLHEAVARMSVARVALTDRAASENDGRPRWPAAPLPAVARPRFAGDGEAIDAIVPDVFRRAQSRFTLTGRIAAIEMRMPPDVVHWSHPVPLFVPGAPNIYTVHDLIPLENPVLTGVSAGRFMRLLQQILPRAAHVMTVSETVRHALSEQFGLPLDQITCCHQPVDAPVPGGALPASLRSGGFLLCLGRFEPRKNVARLIEAYRLAAPGVPLVFAGPGGDWPDRREYRRVAAMVDGRHVIRLGWNDRPTVDALIAHCTALLMPSLAEGFGLPVVEAMRAGKPTMASRHGAAAEIAGDAALLVDPESEAEIMAGIVSLTDDQSLRAALQRKGIERAAQFTPKVFGDRLAALYEKISGRVIRPRQDDERGPGCA